MIVYAITQDMPFKIEGYRGDQMLIKTDRFELEISLGDSVYFGSKTYGQIFRKWEEFKEDEKQQIQTIQNSVRKLLLESESILLSDPNNQIKKVSL